MKRFISVFLALAVLVSLALPVVSAPDAVFVDVPPDAEYSTAVNELSKISELGYGDGTFRPNDLITRAEFITLLLKILEAPDISKLRADQIFADVPVSHWANRYISRGFDNRLISGHGGGIFSPDDNIAYEEAVKIIVSYLRGGSRGLSYPHGFIDAAEKMGITDVHAEIGQKITRWQAAMLMYFATTAEVDDYARSSYSATYTEEDYYDYAPTALADYDAPMAEAEFVSEPMPSASLAPVAPSMSVEATDTGVRIDEDLLILPDYPTMDERQISAGLLTAGEWNDNENWDFWNRLMANREWFNAQSQWNISTSRYAVRVTDGGAPVIRARVELAQSGELLWTAYTDNSGYAYIFAEPADEQSNEFTLTVSTSDDTVTIEGAALSDSEAFEVEIAQGYVADSIDVMLMVDTTGSMGDELQYLKEELSDVITRINSDVRVSCNFYRDINDEYIVRPFAFTSDIDEAVGQISKQRATGGGDYPEAVELALANAIYEHDWNPDAKEHFLILVLDAPPHYDAGRIAAINECIRDAAAMGIRIIPVASSGVDKDTEFLLRSMSIVTGGTYVFLTDDSGIGNSHIEPTVGEYTVEFLNDLLVGIINGRL